MKLRNVGLLVLVLLFSGDNLRAEIQNETLTQTAQEEQELGSGEPEIVPQASTRKLKWLKLRQTFQQTPGQLEPRAAGDEVPQESHPEAKATVQFEQWTPVAADSVEVRCGEDEVTVNVSQDFLGNGQLIRPSDLTLGGCPVRDSADHILHFQTDLQSCGSTAVVTDDALIYTLTLKYTPTPIGSTYILKTSPAEVVVECYYPRRHDVSSEALRPTWKPFAAARHVNQRLRFSLRLMTEDWQSQRPSSVYFLSDVMHMEASVLQGHHIPLRVYVDSCVATTDPNPDSQPRYVFISNHGCFTDAKLTGAKSYFMQRLQEDKLHFQLKAFRFNQDHRNSIYITCKLKATTISVPVNSQYKACSFLTEVNRWVASGGDNQVCVCCESSCSEQRWRRNVAAADADVRWEGTAALGPVLLQDDTVHDALMGFSDLSSELQTHEVINTDSSAWTVLPCAAGAALGLVLLLFVGAVTCTRHKPKSTDYSVCT